MHGGFFLSLDEKQKQAYHLGLQDSFWSNQTKNSNKGVFMPTRLGAQCVKLICAEPATNTPGAQRRFDEFILPFLQEAGIQVDVGQSGRLRYLKDRLQLPGIIRRYVADYKGWREDVVHDSLNLLFPAHNLELIVLIEHTNCAERKNAFMSEHGRFMTPEEEMALINRDLQHAEQYLREWHMRSVRQTGLKFIKAVGIVTDTHSAADRRMENVVTLEVYNGNGVRHLIGGDTPKDGFDTATLRQAINASNPGSSPTTT